MSEIGTDTLDEVDTWIYGTLAADSALDALVDGRISGSYAEGQAMDTPYVAFILSSARDRRTSDGTLIWADCMYTIKAVGRGSSWSVVSPTYSRVHALVQQRAGVMLPNSLSLTSCRETVIKYPEVDNGEQWRHEGGSYRIRLSRA